MPVVMFDPTFQSSEVVSVEVEEGVTLQEAAFLANVPMGDACGGNCGCSTCHVHVRDGIESLEEMDDDEDDILGKADDVRHISRLGCQVRVGTKNLKVHITRESQIAFVNEHPETREQFEKNV
jgi:ferredoxin, 2Fe-2S